MIVVAVRDQRRADPRKWIGPQRRRSVPRDQIGDALAEDGIDQEGGAVELQEPARVAQPGDACRLAGLRGDGELAYVGRYDRNGRPGRALAAPAGEPVEDGPAEDRAARARSAAVEIREPGHSSIVSARPDRRSIGFIRTGGRRSDRAGKREEPGRSRRPLRRSPRPAWCRTSPAGRGAIAKLPPPPPTSRPRCPTPTRHPPPPAGGAPPRGGNGRD